MKNRLGIFVFYDVHGIADQNIEELLKGLIPELGKLVVVVNGIVTDESKLRLEKYADELYIRENIGYDGGAYKDAFLKFLKYENWNKWDEIILFNDTFFAPIFPWKAVFDKMEKTEADFWGLTRGAGGGRIFATGKIIAEHIQAYFLVITKRMFMSPDFWQFWENLEYPVSYWEAVGNFEVDFTVFFRAHGFIGQSYIDLYENEIKQEVGEKIHISYISHVYELLKIAKLPILKKKAISVHNFINSRKALEYIRENSEYDVSLITSCYKRLNEEGRLIPVNPKDLERFYDEHTRIFIYGHGKTAKNMADYFEYRNWNFEGFLVTSSGDAKVTERVYSYDSITFEKNDGIVLALGKEALSEVYPMIKDNFSNGQIFCPNYEN